MAIERSSRRARWLAGSLLAATTLLAYWPVKDLQFVNYDDTLYVTSNTHVQGGLDWSSISWAFRTTSASNWHPLTWLSHLLDYQLYGLNPSGHHVTSLLIHLVNVLLLFWVLQLTTGMIWRSTFVAALFAVHPLNVESVAWIAERKNLLSTLFLLLTILAYVRYAAKPGWRRYAAVVVLFACGLMSKPMLVTLPFALLLIDYWPLERFNLSSGTGAQEATPTVKTAGRPGKPNQSAKSSKSGRLAPKPPRGEVYLRRSPRRLVLEKIPLMLLATASSIITIIAQRRSGAVDSLQAYSPLNRIENAVVSYVIYLEDMIWPRGLAVFYPHPKGTLAAWQVTGAAILLLGVTAFVIWKGKRFKYLPPGWLWYLGTLVPVIGLIQVGAQARADRYAYVPLIGIFILITWAASDWAARNASLEKWLRPAAICATLALIFATWVQLATWQDSVSLFEHASSVTHDNYVAYCSLGEGLAREGKTGDAAVNFAKSIQANPLYDQAHHNLGMALVQQGKTEDGIAQFKTAIQLNPKFVDAYNKLGAALASQGRYDEALPYLNRVIELDPEYATGYANLGSLFERQGKVDQALDFDYKALRLLAKSAMELNSQGANGIAAQINYRVGNMLVKEGKISEAVEYYREALRLNPGYEPAQQSLKTVLDTLNGTSP
ncbi:MAG TPA: tetratricopeptide repeat protein [Blastocatellia bacterium]|nr:tetratricopeptide repeat protein [Blastocatellia bacterium]